ncbi:hypothetical protein H5J22_03610 [Cetobacterium sp. 8H]|uniref:hypothetical protein n=1 Tax=Cetobacterium sp. 8H TaxID=2759681 RepID=UPI00163CF6D8|nr:hypothetical protein [Cetobacterium sp. 8H]MBC2850528.1 hypothetical protein [Cetobacterium sp. 8H]
MYSQGETFYHTFDDEEFELTVLENLIIRDKEYLITEDFDGTNHIFLYDEDEDDLQLIDDSIEVNNVLDFWKDQYLGADDIGDWDDDEYYDREDSYDKDDYYDMDYDDEKDYY